MHRALRFLVNQTINGLWLRSNAQRVCRPQNKRPVDDAFALARLVRAFERSGVYRFKRSEVNSRTRSRIAGSTGNRSMLLAP